MQKYSILIAALLVLTAVSACEKKAQNAAAPTPAATAAPAAPSEYPAPKPTDAAAPVTPEAPEKK